LVWRECRCYQYDVCFKASDLRFHLRDTGAVTSQVVDLSLEVCQALLTSADDKFQALDLGLQVGDPKLEQGPVGRRRGGVRRE
jgi:hypothetical protein